MLTEGALRATGISIFWPPLDSPTILTCKKARKEGDNMEKNKDNEVRKWYHLSPEEKFQIFIEATMAKGNGNVSEVLRRWDIHANDLTRIRQAVEEGAISIFEVRKSRNPR